MTSKGGKGSNNDAGNDNVDIQTVTVTNHPTPDTMNKLHTVLDLGSLVNNNKHQPDFDMFDDDVSQVTVTIKNWAEGKSNTPQIPNSPMKPKKSHKNKNQKQKEAEGRKTSNE